MQRGQGAAWEPRLLPVLRSPFPNPAKLHVSGRAEMLIFPETPPPCASFGEAAILSMHWSLSPVPGH